MDMLAHDWRPEDIRDQHPHLPLAGIYAALAYYYDHQVQIDDCVERSVNMSYGRLYAVCLGYTIVSACICAGLAFAASFIVGFCFFHDALMFRLTGGSIDTSELHAFDHMQTTLVWVGVGAGIVIAQTVFLAQRSWVGGGREE